MPLTLGFGRTFRPFGRYPTMAGGETSQANRSGSRRPQIRRKTTPGVANGRTSAIKAEPGPPDRRTAPTHPFDAGFAFGPAPRPPQAAPRQDQHTTPLAPVGSPNEMFGENSRDRKDFLVATSKAPSSSSAPQGARRPPLPPGGGRLVSGAGTRGSYERVAPAVMSRLPARALLTGQPSLAMPTNSSNFA
jgi:hypothetical protein